VSVVQRAVGGKKKVPWPLGQGAGQKRPLDHPALFIGSSSERFTGLWAQRVRPAGTSASVPARPRPTPF